MTDRPGTGTGSAAGNTRPQRTVDTVGPGALTEGDVPGTCPPVQVSDSGSSASLGINGSPDRFGPVEYRAGAGAE